MSRDEAIKKMKAVKAYMTAGNPIWDTEEMAEAFDAAIEALEVVPVVRCKDCDFINGCKNAQYLGLDGYCSHAERSE